ncbi:MAG: hypothetical protein JRM99_09335, partial [Nitrososphaerota archaeon]|nr:hypothetical protein [Nitrososphaerota archaeon]
FLHLSNLAFGVHPSHAVPQIAYVHVNAGHPVALFNIESRVPITAVNEPVKYLQLEIEPINRSQTID